MDREVCSRGIGGTGPALRFRVRRGCFRPRDAQWSPVTTWLIYAALTAALFVEWMAMQKLSRRMGDLSPLWCVAGANLATSAVLLLSGYATGGQLGVPIAGGLLAWRLVARLQKQVRQARPRSA